MNSETPVLRTEGGGTNEFVPANQRLRKAITPEELAEKINELSGDEKIGKQKMKRVRPYECSNVNVEAEQLLERVAV